MACGPIYPVRIHRWQGPGGRVSKVCLTGFKDRQDCSWIAPRGTEGVGGAFRAYSLAAAHPYAPIGRHGRSESLRRSRRAVENGYPTADRAEDHQEDIDTVTFTTPGQDPSAPRLRE